MRGRRFEKKKREETRAWPQKKRCHHSEEAPEKKTQEGWPEIQGKPEDVGDTAAGKPASRRRRSSASDMAAGSRKFLSSSSPCRGDQNRSSSLGELSTPTPQAFRSIRLGPQFYTKPACALLAQSVPPKASMGLDGRNSGTGGFPLWGRMPGTLSGAAPTKMLTHKAGKERRCLVTAGGEKTTWAG